MLRAISVAVLTASCAATALAQIPNPTSNAPSPAVASRIAAGSYSGTVQEENGKASSDVKLTVKDVTKDGRITARMQATNTRAACAGNLPANGLVLSDGSVRLEVNDGVPEGCERIYNLRFASGTAVSGSFIGGQAALKTKGGKR